VLLATVKGDVHDIGKNIVGVVLGCNNYEVIDLGVMVSCEKILQTAREKQVDLVGLSGLITPSLDEMVHVAKEMAREGLTMPLLIGGATTSKAHTAVKIAPGRSHPVVHVLDASRAVTVAGSLLTPEQKPAFLENLKADYERARSQHANLRAAPLLALSEARNRAPVFDWSHTDIPKPEFTGLRILTTDQASPAGTGPAPSPSLPAVVRIRLADLVPFIDWSPFFHTWEMRGRYPAILENVEAKKLFADATRLLDEIVAKNLLVARGIYGFFPANSVGDDVELYTNDSREEVLTTFHFLRQQLVKPADQHNHCLADYIAPRSNPGANRDHLGAFAVSAGFGTEELCRRFEADLDDYNSIMTKALADRLAEAFAEFLHFQARQAWGFGKNEHLSSEDLLRERYRGIRPAAGYPACPDHTEKWTLWKLLEAERNTGIKLTESCAMWPGASVSGLYFAHPEAKYFGVGKIDRDQVLDYQARKGMDLKTVEKWLGPWLNYEPNAEAILAPVA
jgi:5-methyltetrahydrofolate--homocysteine methyltransferase